MRINLLALAEYAAIADGSKLVIAGTVNQLEVRRPLGIEVPDAAMIPLPALYLAITVECSLAEGTKHHPFLRLVNEDNQPITDAIPIGEWNFIVNAYGRPMTFNQVVRVGGVLVPGPGDYSFQILVKDTVIGETPLYVVDTTPDAE